MESITFTGCKVLNQVGNILEGTGTRDGETRGELAESARFGFESGVTCETRFDLEAAIVEARLAKEVVDRRVIYVDVIRFDTNQSARLFDYIERLEPQQIGLYSYLRNRIHIVAGRDMFFVLVIGIDLNGEGFIKGCVGQEEPRSMDTFMGDEPFESQRTLVGIAMRGVCLNPFSILLALVENVNQLVCLTEVDLD